ncbi:MAG: hypothetical protein M1833_003634 [Piccolia ochrophora]|nr:MAG: hypothetical protein M1833_003634 [Piccolia ochrophora]
MQYVRSISGSVSKTWNSINPATLSGAIDVIVVELPDGSLACSPFHVRFGKFSLLRPYEKKVEFCVNDVKQDYPLKLGEGGEAFFVFETSDDIPEALQTSPLVSPVPSPQSLPEEVSASLDMQEPDFLDLATGGNTRRLGSQSGEHRIPPVLLSEHRTQSDIGNLTPLSRSADDASRPMTGDWSGISISVQPPVLDRHYHSSDDVLSPSAQRQSEAFDALLSTDDGSPSNLDETTGTAANSVLRDRSRSRSPPPIGPKEAVDRAVALSKKLSGSNIPTYVTDTGDLMLDMTGYKSSEDEALRAELIARKILAEELKGNYDIGALIGADEQGNLWIYSSEEAKEAAAQRAALPSLTSDNQFPGDSASDPGYHSDGERSGPPSTKKVATMRTRGGSASAATGLVTPPQTPPDDTIAGDPTLNYAKTLRLTSDQLMALGLKSGPNSMSFSVNKATCHAFMYYWKFDVPIVISDIDGTITKSDALGHVLNMIGRDWTHLGVAKLYTDIVANGYNILYLTSRSVGQADTTRNYLNGVVQEGYKLPKGPVILSPDRTVAALRREVYLRKPEVFKMACLRDIFNLFGPNVNPFYAGFGNRLTDALSYRSVNIPSTRIFTINSQAEVSLDLLSLNKYRSSYVSIREIVDHFFPPVGLLVTGGGEAFTDFNFWRDDPLDVDDFSGSDSAEETENDEADVSLRSEDEGSDGLEEADLVERLRESIDSRLSVDDTANMGDSFMESSMAEEEDHALENLMMDDGHEPVAEENEGAVENHSSSQDGVRASPTDAFAKTADPELRRDSQYTHGQDNDHPSATAESRVSRPGTSALEHESTRRKDGQLASGQYRGASNDNG